MESLLTVLGIDADAEALYLDLARGSRPTVASLPPRVVEQLRDKGLVYEVDGHLVAQSARPILEAWANRAERDVIAARGAALRLAQVYGRSAEVRRHGYVDFLSGVERVREAFYSLQSQAARKVEAFDVGPYTEPSRGVISPEQREALARGVQYRVLYESASRTSQGSLEHAYSAIEAGEEARFVDSLPTRLTIVDRDRAQLVIREGAAPQVDCLVVYPSPLLDALISIFDHYWSQSRAIDRVSGALNRPSDEQLAVVRLAATGIGDAAISRALGISQRTVQRRVLQLQELSGAGSRFQLGVLAERFGWL